MANKEVNYTDRCRKLRENSTDAELALWGYLRDRRLGGYKFRRQKQIGLYIADFVCCKSKVIIELDGGHHLDRKEYDDERTLYLRSMGYTVVRFWNDEVFNNINSVLEVILASCIKQLNPHPNPLPKLGEILS